MAGSVEEYIDPKILADGNVLLGCKIKFLKDMNQENLLPMLGCLRDSMVFVPVAVEIDPEDEQAIVNRKEGEKVSTKNPIRLKHDVVNGNGGKRYLPVFSQPEQISEDYRVKHSIINAPFVQCVKMAHASVGLDGLVLDAFTNSLFIPFEMADAAVRMPSHLKP